jgi:hypothetical protein
MSASSSDAEYAHERVRVDKNTFETVFMSNRVEARNAMCTEHLEKESHLLNTVAPFMRRYEHGVVHFDSPYLLRILAKHKRTKFVAMMAEGKYRYEMQRSTVEVFADGSLDRFWYKYRSTDLALASRFRANRNVAFRFMDALVIPHIMSRELDDEGNEPRESENMAHIVVFVCYPKLRKIYVYDSLYDKSSPSRLARLRHSDVSAKYDSIVAERFRRNQFGSMNPMSSPPQSSRRQDNENYALSVVIGYRWCQYGLQMAMHQIENFVHALEIVQQGIVEGRDSDKSVIAPKSAIHGAFVPEPFKFVHAGFPGGAVQKHSECGLWATLAMHDFARNWRNPTVPHALSADLSDPRAFFARPRFNAVDYTAVIVADMIRRYILTWRHFDPSNANIRVPTMSALIIALPSVRPFSDAIKEFYNAACAYTFPRHADTTRSNMEQIDASQLTRQRSVDVLVWVVDARNRSDSERDVYEAIGNNLTSIRFLFIVHPGQSVGVYFRRPVDDRRYRGNTAQTLVYSVPPGTESLYRMDSGTAVASSLYVFGPNRESRKDSLIVELPTPNTRYVQWTTGVGWMCHA